MRVVSFCLRLVGSIAMIVAGGALMAWGMKTLQNIYMLADAMSQQPAAVGEGTNWDMITRDGSALYEGAALGAWVMIAGQLLVGLVLLVLGIRGMVKRLALGLPPAAEAAETPEGRIGHVLAFGAGAAFGLFLMVSSLVGNADQLVPKLMGESAMAVVTGGRTAQDRMRYYNYLAFQFETADGTRVRHETEVASRYLRKYETGAEIEVRYMRSDPARNMLPDTVSHTEFTIRLGFYAFLVVAGIAGVRRNLYYTG